MTRLFVDCDLAAGSELVLPDDSAHHLRSVLRLRVDDDVVLFNRQQAQFAARLTTVSRNRVCAEIGDALPGPAESPLAITLVQSVSRGDRMDYTLQKAVELGVHAVIPVISRRTVVRLDRQRAAKRLQHWRGVVQHATEQSGRTWLPPVAEPQPLENWLGERGTSADVPACVLHPEGGEPFVRRGAPGSALVIIAGPEGGFEDREINACREAGCEPVALGPRILRTETAAVCALAAAQTLWGDFA